MKYLRVLNILVYVMNSQERNIVWGPPRNEILWDTILETKQIIQLVFYICQIVQQDQMISEILQKYKNLWFHESNFRNYFLAFSRLKIWVMLYLENLQGSKSSRKWLDAVFLKDTCYATPHLLLKSSRNCSPLQN